jgi:hypothetical protein
MFKMALEFTVVDPLAEPNAFGLVIVREPSETNKLPVNIFVPPSSKTPAPDFV